MKTRFVVFSDAIGRDWAMIEVNPSLCETAAGKTIAESASDVVFGLANGQLIVKHSHYDLFCWPPPGIKPTQLNAHTAAIYFDFVAEEIQRVGCELVMVGDNFPIPYFV